MSRGFSVSQCILAITAAIIAAAHNHVLSDLFAEFVPVLRQGLIDLVDLLDLRAHEPNHGDEAHATLVRAIERGDPDVATRTLHDELQQTLAQLRRP